MDEKKRIKQLSEQILKHQYKYYVESAQEISDPEYDKMIDELILLEREFPHLALPNSPTKRVGSDLDNTFPERDHTIPVLSLDKEYSVDGIMKWIKKVGRDVKGTPSFVIEEKMDGASIVLYYKKGELAYALTRGNGEKGNDVTDNIRTVKEIPIILKRKINLVVRGEIFIEKKDFEEYNKLFDNRYSNPRNLAAGSLRNIKSSIVASVPLKMYANEGHFSEKLPHIEILKELYNLGFRVTANPGYFSTSLKEAKKFLDFIPGLTTGSISDISGFIKKKSEIRHSLSYEIDGLVVKTDDPDMREKLGITSHHPKWAIAFKFESPIAITKLTDIVIQIGRNGRVTPVAILEPVSIAGSVVSRATLHNREYIEILELGRGDTVTISKRGDIIPAVENIIEKSSKNPEIFEFPKKCPFCSLDLEKRGAHHFCINRNCPERRRRELSFFISKERMNIETLGEKTVSFLFDKGYIKRIPDIYKFDYLSLLGEEGFKEKRIKNIINSVEASKKKPFETVLVSLGFEGLGTFAAKELIRAGFNSFEKIISSVEKNNPEVFSEIEGFGDITAELIIKHFSDKKNIEMIRELGELGLQISEKDKEKEKHFQTFEGQIWVITGSFKTFNPRSKAAKEIEVRGGKISTSVSSKTSFLLAGSSPGSKLNRAESLGIRIINEKEFIKMLKKD